MGAQRRREEEKVCPLCIEVLDATEKSFFPCPCGYQVCLFCFDRLKNDCGNLCPGCRTEYGSANNPFAKRKSSVGAAAEVPASGRSSSSGSPVAATPPAAATSPVAALAASPAGAAPGLTPLQQARQMHQAKLVAAQQAAAQQQAATQQPAPSAAASHLQAARRLEAAAPPPPLPPPAKLQQHQPRHGGSASRQHSETLDSPQQRHQPQHRQPQVLPQQQAVQQAPPPQLSLPSLHDGSLRPQTSLGSAWSGWAQDQPPSPPLYSSSGPGTSTNASMAFDMPLGALPQQQPGQWLAPGSASPFGGAAPAPAPAHSMQATDGLFAAANSSAASPWGSSDTGGGSASAQLQRRMAVAPRPLPLDGGPEVGPEPGAEADLVAARLAVQCGQMSASDAAWKLLSASASVRAV